MLPVSLQVLHDGIPSVNQMTAEDAILGDCGSVFDVRLAVIHLSYSHLVDTFSIAFAVQASAEL